MINNYIKTTCLLLISISIYSINNILAENIYAENTTFLENIFDIATENKDNKDNNNTGINTNKTYTNNEPLSEISGNFYNNAKISVLNQNTGEKTQINISKEKSTKFDNLSISINVCWKQSGDVYSPENKALIEIIDINNRKIIFSGWVFSNHRSISQPHYKKYFFILSGCF